MDSAEVFFSRQRAFDAASLDRLRGSSVAVFGLGNVGGPCAVELARAGVGELLIVDNGYVEDANLSRGIFTQRDVGMTKVAASARVLAERAPHTRVKTIFGDVRVDVPEHIFTDYDAVIVAVDSWSARMFVSRWAHALPGRTRVVVSGGLVGPSWDVIIAIPGSDGGCMQCPYDASIAVSDEEGGCSSAGLVDRRFDPSLSFPAVITTGHMVSVVVDVVGAGDKRLAGRMMSYDHGRHQLDVLRIAPNPACGGHRRLAGEEYWRVPVRDYVVAELATLVAVTLDAKGPVTLAVEREFVTTRTCSGCGAVERVYRPLLTVQRERWQCRACGMTDSKLSTATTLPASARLSELGVPAGKVVKALVNGNWLFVVPTEGVVS